MDAKFMAEIQFSAINMPAPGETECGDAWQIRQTDRGLFFLVADGLGHGPFAAAAAAEAVECSIKHYSTRLRATWKPHTLALRSSRGAAIAVARADLELHKLQYSGVGNIAGSVIDAGG